MILVKSIKDEFWQQTFEDLIKPTTKSEIKEVFGSGLPNCLPKEYIKG